MKYQFRDWSKERRTEWTTGSGYQWFGTSFAVQLELSLPEAVGLVEMTSSVIGADEAKSSNRRVRVVRRERTPGGFIFARLSPSKREQYHVDDK